MARNRERLIIGVGGHVVAIDPSTGEEAWRTKVKGSTFTTIHVSGDKVFAGANGELFCLNASSGEIVWHNKLKGLGLGVVAFPGMSNETAIEAMIAQQRTAAAAAG